MAARSAAAGRDKETARTLREALAGMTTAFEDGKPHDFATADTAFHEALLRGARNDVLSQLVQTVLATLRARYAGHRPFGDETAVSLDRHRELVDAVAAGDQAAAEAASRALVREARAEVLGAAEEEI
jgi:DNA-binding GntR family transcriptional regulator